MPALRYTLTGFILVNTTSSSAAFCIAWVLASIVFFTAVVSQFTDMAALPLSVSKVTEVTWKSFRKYVNTTGLKAALHRDVFPPVIVTEGSLMSKLADTSTVVDFEAVQPLGSVT